MNDPPELNDPPLVRVVGKPGANVNALLLLVLLVGEVGRLAVLGVVLVGGGGRMKVKNVMSVLYLLLGSRFNNA